MIEQKKTMVIDIDKFEKVLGKYFTEQLIRDVLAELCWEGGIGDTKNSTNAINLSENEISSLKQFIESHNEPCLNCGRDLDCGIYKKGKCIAKNMESVYMKLRSDE